MSGRDVIGVAKTGSGKTIAFLLPMFRHIKDQRPIDSLEGPIALIMTPTRELAVQIHKECKHFLKVLGLRAYFIIFLILNSLCFFRQYVHMEVHQSRTKLQSLKEAQKL